MSRTADWYRRFAGQTAAESAVYERWASGVAGDERMLDRLEELPLPKRQPALVFATARLLGAPATSYADLTGWVNAHWPLLRAELGSRMTQTNDPARCAALLPALAALPGPLALVEVGASAGLCLYPDRFSYRYDEAESIDPPEGRSELELHCVTTGPMPPIAALPSVVWRAGIDLNPLDVRDPEDVRWLEALVWPGQDDRLARLRAAIRIAAAEPPLLVRADAVDGLAGLAADAPGEATLVIVTSGILVYLSPAERARFAWAVSRLAARWVSLEPQDVVPSLATAGPARPGRFVLGCDAEALAWVDPHGAAIDWI